jgi:hypothetical protein
MEFHPGLFLFKDFGGRGLQDYEMLQGNGGFQS